MDHILVEKALDPKYLAYVEDFLTHVQRLSLQGRFENLTQEQVTRWIGNLAAWYRMVHDVTP